MKTNRLTFKDVVQVAQGGKLIAKCFRLLKPKPRLKPSDFAEEHIEIPEGNALPGRINFDNAPYQREPLDMMARDDVYQITLMWGAQTGKTSLFTMAMSFFIWLGRSMIMCQPSQGDLKTWLATKFEAMVETCAVIRARIAKPRGRDGVNNQAMKSYLGGFLMFAWSGSPKTMRGRSAPIIVCDEIDGYVRTAEGEPVQLLWKRATTFGDQRKLILSSTPTTKGDSRIDDAFNRGDQRHWHVKCPHCGHEQVMKWEGVKYDKSKDGNVIPESVGYVCSGCGVLWDDQDRIKATRAGKWVAAKPFTGHVSYHLPTMPSTMIRLVDLVRDYIDCERDNDLQTFVNTVEAKVFEMVEDSVKAEEIVGKGEKYIHQVPRDVYFLTMGVDIQHNRIELEVVGWGHNYESWSIDYKVIVGETDIEEGTKGSPWDELTKYWQTEWVDFLGEPMMYRGIAVDSGDGTRKDTVLRYCAKYQGRKVFAVKGYGGFGRPIVSKPSEVTYGKRTKRKTTQWPLGVDVAKFDILKMLQKKKSGQPGFCHFPAGRDDEYFRGLAESEKLKRYYQAGRKRLKFEWDAKIRNEPLDCRVYAYAGAKRESPNWDHEKLRLDQRIRDHLQLSSTTNAVEGKGRRRKTKGRKRTAKTRV